MFYALQINCLKQYSTIYEQHIVVETRADNNLIFNHILACTYVGTIFIILPFQYHVFRCIVCEVLFQTNAYMKREKDKLVKQATV